MKGGDTKDEKGLTEGKKAGKQEDPHLLALLVEVKMVLPMSRKGRRGIRGFAIMLVLMMLLLLLMLGVAFFFSSWTHAFIACNYLNMKRAFVVAEGGVWHAIGSIIGDFAWSSHAMHRLICGLIAVVVKGIII